MIIAWNARGAAGRDFGNALKELMRRYKPSMVILVETRCSGSKAQKVIKNLGFKHQIIEEARGLSGGIWILWKDDMINVSVIAQNKQYIHCQVTGIGRCTWNLTAIYASPREQERKELWECLRILANRNTGPWLLLGDFNDIRDEKEQRRGGKIDERKCRRFSENIEKCRLIDLGAEGPNMTWRGPLTSHGNRLFKRLDRGLCNQHWRNLFGEAWLRVGPRLNSDHHPLLVFMEEKLEVRRNRPFRSEACWMKHEDFRKVVKKNWEQPRMVWQNLKQLEPKLLDWNVNVFGHIARRKAEILRRLEGIQRSLHYRHNPFLDRLEGRLQEDLRKLLDEEELLWFQKART
ncbi:uncharacterized protein LOC114712575 [Neltuma alba]|uniref:uncharacterized protein LOC114712575 n=1 Tax=Neltuma alba TaxID=207710 RepID=UPI0010A39FA3|nr:uncharacterized protein LOC114712575 [Prosopis alba]